MSWAAKAAPMGPNASFIEKAAMTWWVIPSNLLAAVLFLCWLYWGGSLWTQEHLRYSIVLFPMWLFITLAFGVAFKVMGARWREAITGWLLVLDAVLVLALFTAGLVALGTS